MANSYRNEGLTKGYDADAAVTKYRAVKAGVALESVTPITGVNDVVRGVSLFGVTTDEIARGKGVTCQLDGIAEWEAGGAINVDEAVTIDSVGRCIKATEVVATLATGVVGNNNAITWTERDAAGPPVAIQLKDPAANTQALKVDVANNGTDIIVSLATDGGGAITSTAQQVMDAVQANGDADRLVTTANTSTSTGAGVVVAVALTPLAGGAGPAAGGLVHGRALTAAAQSGNIIAVRFEPNSYPIV